ncbi:MAG: 50S ribosomal protein L21 [Candidatus Moranbacteria bacterium]|nr:50S ribosomal protein L21 [Candidatus Moranbacteria bacterium]
MLAIIKSGGKQYKVKEGDKVKLEKLEGEEGSLVTFQDVLFMGDENKIQIGKPFLEGALVEGKIIRTEKGKKVTGVKFKAKKRYKVKFGHRQIFTEVEITKVA